MDKDVGLGDCMNQDKREEQQLSKTIEWRVKQETQ